MLVQCIVIAFFLFLRHKKRFGPQEISELAPLKFLAKCSLIFIQGPSQQESNVVWGVIRTQQSIIQCVKFHISDLFLRHHHLELSPC